MQMKKRFIKFLFFPIFFMVGLLSFASYMAWKECSLKRSLVDKALEGNPYAITILANYEKPWKLNEKILLEALKGNKNALKVLKLDQASD